jgi:tetratricopeptide (TPR) repeat protein
MAKTQKQLALACEHLRAGNLARARSLFQRIVRNDPLEPAAWHYLGITLAKSGDLEMAATLVGKAIQLRGPEVAWCLNLGHILRGLGRPREAAACFRQALAARPLDAGISLNLGLALFASSEYAASVLALQHAAELNPADPDTWFHLGNAHYQAGDHIQAAESYERVLRMSHLHAGSIYNLGVIRMAEGKNKEAIHLFERTIELNPESAEAHNNLALLRQSLGQCEEAATGFKAAERIRPWWSVPRYNRARLLAEQDDLSGCCELYETVLRENPEHTKSRVGLGNALVQMGRPREAIEHFRSALEFDSQSAAADFNLSLALLQCGDWQNGWPLFEWRSHKPGLSFRTYGQRRWAGEPLKRDRILVYAEQGFGDSIQFSRYLQLLADRDGRIIFECQPNLVRLMRAMPDVERIIGPREDAGPFDWQVPLLSLAGILGTSPDSVPQDVPYLLADRESADEYTDFLAHALDPGLFRVGLTWAGNPGHENNQRRSIPPSALNLLAGLDGIAWIDLQKDAAGSPGMELSPVVHRCSDFAETAAAILNLDLVISADTAVAHLAGAMGKPVWTLLPYAADWRWMLDRSDTPWYPTMRLFRQPRRGDWQSVISEVRSELVKLVGA